MSLYQRARKEERVFLSLTGLRLAEFDELLPFFQAAWKEAIETAYKQDATRQRKPGGGKEPALNTPEKRLFFILYYLKTYPLQEVMAFHSSEFWVETPVFETGSLSASGCLILGRWTIEKAVIPNIRSSITLSGRPNIAMGCCRAIWRCAYGS